MTMESGPTEGRISIVLPAYNEEMGLGSVIRDIRRVMEKEGLAYELILVDDGSTDRTAAIGREQGLRVLRHPVNRGSGAARKTGILSARGDIIVMMDADGTYPADSIPEALRYLPEYDQVSGVRSREFGRLRFLRTVVKWAIRKFASLLAKREIPDLNTGFKVFKRDIALKYIHLLPDGFSCTTTLTLAFVCNGHFVKHIPIEYFPRIGKTKFHPVKDTLNYVVTILRMIMYFNPLRIILPLSFLLAVIGVLKTIYDVYFKVYDMQESDIVILMTAVILGVFGLLADLIVTQGKR